MRIILILFLSAFSLSTLAEQAEGQIVIASRACQSLSGDVATVLEGTCLNIENRETDLRQNYAPPPATLMLNGSVIFNPADNSIETPEGIVAAPRALNDSVQSSPILPGTINNDPLDNDTPLDLN
jgi:hypothetical protein